MSESTVKSFSVMDALTGVSYPEDHVTIYTDAKSAYAAHALEKRDADETDPEASNANVEQITALKQKVRDSALTFHLQGYPPQVHRDIETEARSTFKIGTEDEDSEGAAAFAFHKGIALAIRKVVSADGSEDTRRWTPEDVEKLRFSVHLDQFNRLSEKVSEVVFAGVAFDTSVTPDFS